MGRIADTIHNSDTISGTSCLKKASFENISLLFERENHVDSEGFTLIELFVVMVMFFLITYMFFTPLTTVPTSSSDYQRVSILFVSTIIELLVVIVIIAALTALRYAVKPEQILCDYHSSQSVRATIPENLSPDSRKGFGYGKAEKNMVPIYSFCIRVFR